MRGAAVRFRSRSASFEQAIILKSSVKIPNLHLQHIDRKGGNENIPWLDRRRSIPRIRTSRRSVGELVAPARRQFELPSRSAKADRSPERSNSCWAMRCTTSPSRWMRPLIAIMLDPSTTRRRRAQLRPDDDVCRTGLVLDRQEHHAFCRSWHLTDPNEAPGHQPPAIAGRHGFTAGDEASSGEILAQESDRVFAQGQASMAVYTAGESRGLMRRLQQATSRNSAQPLRLLSLPS